ncbi:DNA sulfur modification protein DndD [Phorcysia thermohydrogeniphila]|uniref:DNA sulfur modification protein DndD n=2 Tax=Phorcysia thermohydrogeniphila TaxID=936138 RepID=A0A4R1G8J3_9BACT|nr:DNA sulfur modification protein DndD [Phorcysia thermohydrogeniphila]
MILTSLTLENVGLYKGKNVLDLRPKEGKNIVLFGGKNGTGKTTLLESVKLCLYGNNIYGYTKKQYEEFIKKLIHKGEKSAQVTLEFIYFSLESHDTYKVVRKWDLGKRFKEEFLLYKNGEIYKEIPREQWQEFISDIIPPSLVNFFFFDGEKIEKLAEDFSEVEFVNDVKSLLGVTVIDTLRTSLDILRKRYINQEDVSEEISQKLQELEEKRKTLEKELEKKLQSLADIENKKQVLERKLKTAEREFIEKGGEAFRSYERNKTRKEFLESEIEKIKNEIRELASKDLPLATGMDLVEELLVQLEMEKEIKRINFEKEILQNKLKELENILTPLSLDKEVLEKIRNLFSVNKEIKSDIILDLSEKENKTVEVVIQNLKTNTLGKAKNLFLKLENLEEELLEVESALQNVPEEEFIKPYLEKLSRLERKRMEYETIRKCLEEEIRKLEKEKNKVEKEIEKLESFIKQKMKKRMVIHIIEKSQKVIDRFRKEFVKRKIKILEKEILDAFYKLKRKENFIRDLHINPETFEITLFDVNNRKIPIDRLSSGERQIFAISFLWGLARASGKKLPVIIDTPLGRLDNEHRENLAKNYFPHISHQVIILSTDVEVDKELFEMLRTHISHSYQLVYDEDCMCTKVHKGYFWN